MSESFGLFILSLFFFCIFGFLVFFPSIWRNKAGKKLWRVYREVAAELRLKVKESATGGYGFPDIIGRLKGRKVFIHPIIGTRAGIPKTSYAVEHKIRFKRRVMISLKDTSPLIMSNFRHKLDWKVLKSQGFVVSSVNRDDLKLISHLLDSETISLLKSIANRNGDKSLSIILESGIAILYTAGWERNNAVIKQNLKDVETLVNRFELNAPRLIPSVRSRMFDIAARRGRSEKLDIAFAIALSIFGITVLSVGFYGFVTEPDIFRLLTMFGAGIFLIIIGFSKTIANPKGKK